MSIIQIPKIKNDLGIKQIKDTDVEKLSRKN